jgi:YHS domain-containing protein
MRLAIIMCCLSMIGMGGCAATATTPAAQSNQVHAECTVCKANADLACVDVPVDQTTPSYVYNGKTYYFCSDECRSTFAKHPDKYASK